MNEWAVLVTYVAALAYVGLIVFLVSCLFVRRCAGVDEHAMIPGDERLPKATTEIDP